MPCIRVFVPQEILRLVKTRFSVLFFLFNSLFNRNSFSTQRPYELDESCAMFINDVHFDVLRKTVLYIHSYLEGPNHESVDTIVDAYLHRNDHNVLVLDWSQLANGNYLIDVVPNAKQVFCLFNCEMKLHFLLKVCM